uniref:Uncharacterized protein n=1 Tax=Arundo donax TaxID=35708 RepID=A0A0A8Y362_ARUDO
MDRVSPAGMEAHDRRRLAHVRLQTREAIGMKQGVRLPPPPCSLHHRRKGEEGGAGGGELGNRSR